MLKRAQRISIHDIYCLIRFGITGVAATLIHIGSAYALNESTSFPLIVINILAFLVAFLFSFTGHYFWTFKPTTSKARSMVRFFVVAVSGLAASNIVLAALIAMGYLGDMGKLIISICVIPVISFVLGKTWAFK